MRSKCRRWSKFCSKASTPEGYWTYPVTARAGDRGDTSITQYALLGLWDAERHGVSIPNAVWDRAASWLVATQDSDGAFWYHPGNEQYQPTHSIVAAGTANVLVCRGGAARGRGSSSSRGLAAEPGRTISNASVC